MKGIMQETESIVTDEIIKDVCFVEKLFMYARLSE
jgi:hypothetical protein